MSQDTWDAVDHYIGGTLVGSDPALETALTESAAAGLPAIAVAPNQGKFLHLLGRAIGAQNILEVGTLGGYSAIWLARALVPGGRLVTLEAEPRHAEVARRNLDAAGLTDVVEVRVGPALESLPKLAAEGSGPFDLVFIDADKPSTPEYVAWALELTRPGSLIVIDNVVRGGKIADAASGDPGVEGIRRANALLGSDPRVAATALQTVGVKGYDGLTIALVRPEG